LRLGEYVRQQSLSILFDRHWDIGILIDEQPCSTSQHSISCSVRFRVSFASLLWDLGIWLPLLRTFDLVIQDVYYLLLRLLAVTMQIPQHESHSIIAVDADRGWRWGERMMMISLLMHSRWMLCVHAMYAMDKNMWGRTKVWNNWSLVANLRPRYIDSHDKISKTCQHTLANILDTHHFYFHLILLGENGMWCARHASEPGNVITLQLLH